MLLSTLFVLFQVCWFISSDTVPSSETISKTDDSAQWKCEYPGYTCADCDYVSLCVQTAPGQFKQTNVKRCYSYQDLYCDSVINDCSERISHCSMKSKFQCTSGGYFPDQYECSVFYICGNNTGGTTYDPKQRVLCPPNTGFDLKVQNCTLSLTNPLCTDAPVPKCTSYLQTGALEQNPNYYYVCLEDNYPLLYRCKDGEVYDAAKFSCVNSYKKLRYNAFDN